MAPRLQQNTMGSQTRLMGAEWRSITTQTVEEGVHLRSTQQLPLQAVPLLHLSDCLQEKLARCRSWQEAFGCDRKMETMLKNRSIERGRAFLQVQLWSLKMWKGHTTLHCFLLTLPLVLVCFGVAAEQLCVSITAVVSVAAPEDQHGGQCFHSRAANADWRQP